MASKPWRSAPLMPDPAKQGWPVWRSRWMGLSITPTALPAPMWTGLTAYKKTAAWRWNMVGPWGESVAMERDQ